MRKLVFLACLFLLVSQAYAAITVGQFIDRIATTRDVSSLKFDRNKVLTEGLMVEVSVAMGIKVTTQTPDKVVTDTQVETYFSAFNHEFHGNRQGPPFPPPGPPPDPPPPKKAKGKGPNHSPTDPNGNH